MCVSKRFNMRNKTKKENTKPKADHIIQKLKQQHTIVSILPADILIEIFARVASSSFTDLFNAKLCCKDFLGAAEEDCILEHISMDKFAVIPWCKNCKQLSFFTRCKQKGNPEALYRQGMVEYFSSRNLELGLEYLKRATNKGHVEASYAYGVILVSRGGEKDHQDGLNVPNSLSTSSSSKSRRSWSRIRECRKRTKDVVRKMWINNYIVIQPNARGCCRGKNEAPCTKSIIYGRKRWWSDYDDEEFEDVSACDACRWEAEAVWFCKMLCGGV